MGGVQDREGLAFLRPDAHDLPVKSHHYSRHSGELKQALKDAVPHDVLKALHEPHFMTRTIT